MLLRAEIHYRLIEIAGKSSLHTDIQTHTTVLRPFSWTTWVRQCQKKSCWLYGPRKYNRGRHTDNLSGYHSIRANQRPTSSIPPFYAGCPSCRNPPNLSGLETGTKYAALQIQWLSLLYSVSLRIAECDTTIILVCIDNSGPLICISIFFAQQILAKADPVYHDLHSSNVSSYQQRNACIVRHVRAVHSLLSVVATVKPVWQPVVSCTRGMSVKVQCERDCDDCRAGLR